MARTLRPKGARVTRRRPPITAAVARSFEFDAGI
jgi:hypothetical protein